MLWRWLLLGLLAATACSAPFRFKVEIARETLEDRLGEDFPISQELFVVRMDLHDPEVLLEPGSDRIGLLIKSTVTIADTAEMRGQLAVDGTLHYDPEEGAFYLYDPRTVTADIEGLDPTYLDPVKKASDIALAAALPNIPLYTLEGGDEDTAKMFIKSVAVEDGRVMVEMGL